MAEQGLLDYLAEKSGCAYLSELREGTKKEKIRKVLMSLHADRYSMEDWQDAAEYLTDAEQKFEDKQSAKAYLKTYFQDI